VEAMGNTSQIWVHGVHFCLRSFPKFSSYESKHTRRAQTNLFKCVGVRLVAPIPTFLQMWCGVGEPCRRSAVMGGGGGAVGLEEHPCTSTLSSPFHFISS
jgi:hypothetical protein